MTGEEAAADKLKRELGFHVRSLDRDGALGWLESLTLDDEDKLIARSCRPVHKPEVTMWKKLVELQAKIDVLELPA